MSETKLIAEGTPLADGDAVAILRKAARCTSVNTSVGDVLRYNVPGNEPSTWQTAEDACEALADMVECDYVRRDAYDVLKRASERDADVMESLSGQLSDMITERDEWRAKAEESEHAMNAAAGKWAKADADNRELRKMLLLDDGTVEDYTERADPLTALAHQKQLAEEWCERCHAAEAACDEWKARAESAIHAEVRKSQDSEMDGKSCRQYADLRECGKSAGCESDTREKIEAEIDEIGKNTWWKSKVLEWLDRQKAITERGCAECAESMGEYADSLCDPLKERIAELQAQVDDYRAEWHRVCEERMNLARDLGECMAERDELHDQIQQIRSIITDEKPID